VFPNIRERKNGESEMLSFDLLPLRQPLCITGEADNFKGTISNNMLEGDVGNFANPKNNNRSHFALLVMLGGKD
jgi:hypothetical protein